MQRYYWSIHIYLLAGILAVLVLVVIFITIYNSLIGAIEAIRNNEKQIDIQLDRRYKIFESLINTVKKYMDYEQSTLAEVVKLRKLAVNANNNKDDKARRSAEDSISNLASGLNVTFERYPELKANEEVGRLQEEIVNTENRLSYAKQAFNDSIERYNVSKKSLIQKLVVNMFPGSLDMNFAYWELPKETIKERENYTVKL